MGQLQNYNKDLNKLYLNLEKMVSEISKIEVECRQKKHYRRLEEPTKIFMESVDRLEKLILIAKLIE